MNVRGTLTLALLALSLLVSDLIQRLFVAGSAALFPSRRHRILAAWQQTMARLILGTVGLVGGARIRSIPRIPTRPGVLVLMNHQSLLDIPLVVRACRPGYPRIVTRERYARGKPVISHMVRLYQYPTVDPRAMIREGLGTLARAAAESPVPMVIYPEGTRTRDGSIGRFKRRGLRAVLTARQWEVWMVTVDGYWECARLADFRANVARIDGRIRVDGPFPAPPPGAEAEDVDAFLDDMEARMAGYLAELREEAVA